MKKLAALCTFAALTTLSATAQDWAKANLGKSPRHGEYVTITEAGGRKLQAWVVYPEVKGKAPVVVMIHEIFGQTDWAREMADEVAAAGYIVVEPDLLSGFGPPPPASAAVQKVNPGLAAMGCDPMACAPGQTPTRSWHADGVSSASVVPASYAPQQPREHDHMQMGGAGAAFVPAMPGGTAAFPDQQSAVKAVSGLDAGIVTADLDAAADYGKKLPSANGKLFVAGFCWGGGKSFLFATHRHDLSGAMVFYGPPPPVDALKAINAPVFGFYAGNDARITSTVPDTTAAMQAAGKTYAPITYDGAGHGFMRAGEAPDANAANAAARAAGFRRFVDELGGVR